MGNERLFRGAGVAGAVDGEVGAAHASAFREIPEFGWVEIAGGVGVDDFAAGLAVKMDVLVEIGAVAGLAALEVDELDQAVGSEVLQAVVNRGQRDVRGARFDSIQNVIGCRVIGRGGKNIEDLAAMRC